MKNLPKEWPEKIPFKVSENTERIEGYNSAIEACTNALPSVIESVREEHRQEIHRIHFLESNEEKADALHAYAEQLQALNQ